MPKVFVQLVDGDIPKSMQEMRLWLDARGFEPSEFKYRTAASGAVVELTFKIETEAQSFATRFRGRPIPD